MKKKPSDKQSGSTLAVVIATLAILMVIVGVAVQYTTNINRNTQRTTILQTATAVGDSAIEVLFTNWRAICSGKEQTSGGTFASPSGTPLPTNAFSAVPTPSPFPNLSGTNFVKRGIAIDPASDGDYNSTYTISNYKVIGVSAEYTAVANANATPEPQLGQLNNNVNNNSAQMNTTSATWNYIASADVTLQASFGSATRRNVVARVRRVFSKQQLSPWNFAIFYIDPLEIHPGPQFTVTGWVNTNSNLYTAHNTLTFADKVTYGGDWYVNFMPGDTYHNAGSDAEMGQPTYPNGLPPARGQALQPFGLDSTSIFSTTDSNPNNDSYAELIQPPVSGNSDPLAGQRYWDQASVVIKIDASNNITIGRPNADGSITDYNVPPSNPNYAIYHSLYTMFSGAISTNETIQDNREGASMRIATLDVSQIESADISANGVKYKSPLFNGIVYIYDASETPSARRGIRLKNGSKIPFSATIGASGLTVASDNPVYIQGDFNTGGTASSVPSNNPSNFNADGTYVDPSNPPNPQVSGYTRAPCSVLADAVNLLSNSWNDASSGTVPAASPTTFNTAIVSGIVPTNGNGDGAYSGGAENFPRFLENWTNKTLTYYGSMVELYKSQQSVGEWGKANVYVPPTREWFFDNNFRITAPIGSLMVYSYVKGRWYVL
jgi:hypothetical protein